MKQLDQQSVERHRGHVPCRQRIHIIRQSAGNRTVRNQVPVLILRTLDRRVQTQGSLTVLQWTVFCSSSRQYFVLPADSILFFQLTVFCSSSGQYTFLPADSMIYCSSRTGMVLHGLFVSSEQYNSFFFHKIYFENVVKIKDPFKVFFSLNSLNLLYLVRLSL